MNPTSKRLLIGSGIGVGLSLILIAAMGHAGEKIARERRGGSLGAGTKLDNDVELAFDRAIQRGLEAAGGDTSKFGVDRGWDRAAGKHWLNVTVPGEDLHFHIEVNLQTTPAAVWYEVRRHTTGETIEREDIDLDELFKLHEQFGGMIWRRPVPRQTHRRAHVRVPGQRWQ